MRSLIKLANKGIKKDSVFPEPVPVVTTEFFPERTDVSMFTWCLYKGKSFPFKSPVFKKSKNLVLQVSVSPGKSVSFNSLSLLCP